MDTVMLSNFIAHSFGMMVAMYLVIKLIEWVIIKRIIKKFNIMVTVSSFMVLILCCLSAINQQRNPGAMIVVYVISALVITGVRIVWHKLSSEKAAKKALESVQ